MAPAGSMPASQTGQGQGRNVEELKGLVVHTLETNGVLGQIRAELRANVYKAIDCDEDVGASTSVRSAMAQAKMTKSPVGQLMAEIVAEFFEFYHFRLTHHARFGSDLRSRGSVAATFFGELKMFARIARPHGSDDYIGEEVSQLEHALQAADLAQRSGLGADATIAALLHDVGHMIGMEDPSSARMEDCGVVDHEKLGGQWLAELGFSQQVCDLVARHVDGKRYLCAVKKDYHDTLSPASKTTLRHQGGPMTIEEAKGFEEEELHKTIVAMRHWDEAAKVKGKEVPTHTLSVFLPESNLGKERRSRAEVAVDAGLIRIHSETSILEQLMSLSSSSSHKMGEGWHSSASSTTASSPPPQLLASMASTRHSAWETTGNDTPPAAGQVRPQGGDRTRDFSGGAAVVDALSSVVAGHEVHKGISTPEEKKEEAPKVEEEPHEEVRERRQRTTAPRGKLPALSSATSPLSSGKELLPPLRGVGLGSSLGSRSGGSAVSGIHTPEEEVSLGEQSGGALSEPLDEVDRQLARLNRPTVGRVGLAAAAAGPSVRPDGPEAATGAGQSGVTSPPNGTIQIQHRTSLVQATLS
eukprot:s205_g28.t3